MTAEDLMTNPCGRRVLVDNGIRGTITGVQATPVRIWNNQTHTTLMVSIQWDGCDHIYNYTENWKGFKLVNGLDEVFDWLE
jgi:hypothetical protein